MFFLFLYLEETLCSLRKQFPFLGKRRVVVTGCSVGQSSMELASQRGCASSILRGIPELAGESPEQSGLMKELPLL